MKKINEKIIDLCFTYIILEGGNGDALWLSKYTNIIDLALEVKDYATKHNINWEIILKDNYLLWGQCQEWVEITTDKNHYEIQCNNFKLNINM